MVGGDCCVPNPFNIYIGVALQKKRRLQGSNSAGCYIHLTFLVMFSGSAWLLKT